MPSLLLHGRIVHHPIQINQTGFTGQLRTVKYEDVYLRDYQTVPEVRTGIDRYFGFYNRQRLHQALDYQTPAEVYFGTADSDVAATPVSSSAMALSRT